MSYRTILACGLASCLLPACYTAAAETANPPAAEWLPADTIVALEVSQPDKILDVALQQRVLDAVTASPGYQQQTTTPQFRQAMEVVRYFEQQQQSDWQTLLRRLVGGGITVAVGPRQAFYLIVDCRDAKLLQDVHQFFLMVARGEADKQGQPDRIVSADYRGVTGWRFGPQEVHALIGNRLVLTNTPENLKRLLDLRAGEGGACLASLPTYQDAGSHVDADTAAGVYLNSAVVQQVPQLQNAFRGDVNPMATLLLQPWITALRDSSWMQLNLAFDQDQVRAVIATDASPDTADSPNGFASPVDDGGALTQLQVPRQIAAVSVFRDLHRFYAAKDQLFPERTSGLIFFENMMGIFFTGRNLTDEVLAEVEPEIRLVVAGQQHDSDADQPELQLPGFAAVMRMKQPKRFAPIAEEAWQKALGLINFTRGQQAQAGLLIDRPTYEGTKYTLAYFSPSTDQEDAADARFNFSPVLAMRDEYLIFSSTETLARDLIDAVQAESTAGRIAQKAQHSQIVVHGAELNSVLAANKEGLIRNNMVEEGNSREEAEQAIGVLLGIAKAIQRFELTGGNSGPHAVSTLVVDFELP